VAPADGDAVWEGLTAAGKKRMSLNDSYHLVPLDNDASELFAASVALIHDQALAP
jgi:hypothetical protein